MTGHSDSEEGHLARWLRRRFQQDDVTEYRERERSAPAEEPLRGSEILPLLDGLNDYDENYRDFEPLGEIVTADPLAFVGGDEVDDA
ncbi:MAG: hypothetical protein KDH88_09490 [Chromatiales bacterium]|nr:hypothetical protein [Chromatiales bacterium]